MCFVFVVVGDSFASISTVLAAPSLDPSTSNQTSGPSQASTSVSASGDSLPTSSGPSITTETSSSTLRVAAAPLAETEPMDIAPPAPEQPTLDVLESSVIQDSGPHAGASTSAGGVDTDPSTSAENRELLTAIATISAKEVSVIRTTGSVVDRSALLGDSRAAGTSSSSGLDLSQSGGAAAAMTDDGNDPSMLEGAGLASQDDTLPIPLVTRQSEDRAAAEAVASNLVGSIHGRRHSVEKAAGQNGEDSRTGSAGETGTKNIPKK